MKKITHHYFEAVVTGKNKINNIHSLITLQSTLKEMRKVLSEDELKLTNTYQLYQAVLCDTQDFLLET